MVGMVWRLLTRSLAYEIFGMFLISLGIMLGFLAGIRFVRQVVDDGLVQQSPYLIIADTPVFELPPATHLPTLTPTPIPTATPPPLPAIRMFIPAIDLNTSITEIFPTEILKRSEGTFIWEPPDFAVGHFESSGKPEEGGNIVFIGHNNTQGEVFRDLDHLTIGDEVILYTVEKEFHYYVQKIVFVPYLGSEEQGDAALQSYSSPQTAETVTLISCWPYATNSHRIVVIAIPSSDREKNDQ